MKVKKRKVWKGRQQRKNSTETSKLVGDASGLCRTERKRSNLAAKFAGRWYSNPGKGKVQARSRERLPLRPLSKCCGGHNGGCVSRLKMDHTNQLFRNNTGPVPCHWDIAKVHAPGRHTFKVKTEHVRDACILMF